MLRRRQARRQGQGQRARVSSSAGSCPLRCRDPQAEGGGAVQEPQGRRDLPGRPLTMRRPRTPGRRGPRGRGGRAPAVVATRLTRRRGRLPGVHRRDRRGRPRGARRRRRPGLQCLRWRQHREQPVQRRRLPADLRPATSPASSAGSTALPASDPCVNTPPADAYWGLWWSDGESGSWSYASVGAGSLTVPDGGYVAFAWQSGSQSAPGVPATPHASSSASPTSSPSSTPSTGGSGGGGGGTATVATAAVTAAAAAAGNSGGGSAGGGAERPRRPPPRQRPRPRPRRRPARAARPRPPRRQRLGLAHREGSARAGRADPAQPPTTSVSALRHAGDRRGRAVRLCGRPRQRSRPRGEGAALPVWVVPRRDLRSWPPAPGWRSSSADARRAGP